MTRQRGAALLFRPWIFWDSFGGEKMREILHTGPSPLTYLMPIKYKPLQLKNNYGPRRTVDKAKMETSPVSPVWHSHDTRKSARKIWDQLLMTVCLVSQKYPSEVSWRKCQNAAIIIIFPSTGALLMKGASFGQRKRQTFMHKSEREEKRKKLNHSIDWLIDCAFKQRDPAVFS